MMNRKERKEAFLDWINLVLAALLFVAPWALGFANDTVPSWNAWLTAVAIAAVALAAILAFAEWEEWVNVALGLWVVVSPWLLGFAGITNALWSHVVLGALVAALAGWELWLARRSPPRVTA